METLRYFKICIYLFIYLFPDFSWNSGWERADSISIERSTHLVVLLRRFLKSRLLRNLSFATRFLVFLSVEKGFITNMCFKLLVPISNYTFQHRTSSVYILMLEGFCQYQSAVTNEQVLTYEYWGGAC